MIIGIDVSKDKLDICISGEERYEQIKNERANIGRFFAKTVDLAKIELVVFEPTGGYEKKLEKYLIDKEIAHHKVHPTRVHYFAESEGHFAKTDRGDADLLMNYGMKSNVKADKVKNDLQLQIKELSVRRSQLKKMIVSEKLRIDNTFYSIEIKRSIKRMVKQLEKELTLVTGKLEVLIEGDETLKQKQLLLQTVKGVGKEVSTVLITELPELGQINREQISLLVGVAPRTKDSGKKRGYRPISRGRFSVRKALYMAALTAIRFNQRMKKIYTDY